jgi:DNA primase
VTLDEWWPVALADTAAAARAWKTLGPADRKAVRQAVKRAAGQVEEHLRDLGVRLGAAVGEADLDDLLDSWSDGTPISDHLQLELAAAFHRGAPWPDGKPVPGCGCPHCTGLPLDHPARIPAWQRRLAATRQAHGSEHEQERRRAWAERVARARAVPILDIVHRLGLGTPQGQGKEVRVCCPFHDDEHPSLRLNPKRNFWFCDPCGEGGDGLKLYMRVRQVGFADAVQEVTTS